MVNLPKYPGENGRSKVEVLYYGEYKYIYILDWQMIKIYDIISLILFGYPSIFNINTLV